MLSAGDSPAKTSAWPEKGKASAESGADCGPSSPASLAKYNPSSRSWKTLQLSLYGDLTEFSGTWPRWGMMRDGELCPLPIPALPTSENASGLWLTPTVTERWSDDEIVVTENGTPRRRYKNGATSSLGLTQQVKMAERRMVPTPNCPRPHDSEKSCGRFLTGQHQTDLTTIIARDGGQLNPTWVEWLMGWPLDWTDLAPLATDRFQQWCASHGIR